ncbi:hypothetical protein B6V75_08210 [Thioclava sp. F1Mire-8]|nr:hypothetical protein B6V75_08210 [Thioclava sp. F1Mire-8]
MVIAMAQKRVPVLSQKPVSANVIRSTVTSKINAAFVNRRGRLFPQDKTYDESTDLFDDLSRDGRERIKAENQRIGRAVERLVDQKMASGFQVDKGTSEETIRRLRSLHARGARLAGPDTPDSVYELAAALHEEAPWLAQVSTSIMNQGLAHIAAGGVGLRFDPMILVGSPGCGKTHFARLVAEFARTPREIIDVGAGGAGFRVSGMEQGWSTARSGVPVELITETAVANPVIIVDEICKVGGTISSASVAATSLTTSLLQVLERSSAGHFVCPFLRTRFDLSHVNWILTANYEHQIPEPLLDRCQVFRVDASRPEHLVAFFKRAAGGDAEPEELERVGVFIEEMCDAGRPPSLRQIGRLAKSLRAPRRDMLM